MSMLSSQCDTLRVAADALEDEGVMPNCAKLMRDAADTIWQLRNDCVELRGERDRVLRAADGLADTYRLRGRHYRDLYYDAAAENAKLRELVRDMRKAFFTLDIDHCQACPRDTINGPCTKYLVGGSDECNFEEDMRELGIDLME